MSASPGSATLVLAAHGSSNDARCARPVHRHAETIRRRGLFKDVVCVFWKEPPHYDQAHELANGGEMVVVPLMTAAGYYARTVLPREIGTRGGVRYTEPIGTCAAVAGLILAQARETAIARGWSLDDVRLLVVGHGTWRDPRRSGASTWAHARAISRLGGVKSVHVAFLDQAPGIASALAGIPGTGPVIVVPNLVADGGHALDDIPAAIRASGEGRPIACAPAVGERPEIADLISETAARALRGHVALIGAGPGDPELITVKGLRLLQRAEVVLYDRLAPHELLAEAPDDAELIDVGKHPGRPTPSQPWINELIVEHARRGRRVVRLKGGDPYVFGRGGEEAEAVRAAGIDLEVVPGVTSGIAAAALAGVPVTHRGLSKSVVFVTAVSDWDHPANTPGHETQIDHVAHVDTICVYMGLAQIGAVAARLIELGRDPRTPVMSVSAGSTAAQREVVSTLEGIALAVEQAALPSPVMTIIGRVVELREKLAAPRETTA